MGGQKASDSPLKRSTQIFASTDPNNQADTLVVPQTSLPLCNHVRTTADGWRVNVTMMSNFRQCNGRGMLETEARLTRPRTTVNRLSVPPGKLQRGVGRERRWQTVIDDRLIGQLPTTKVMLASGNALTVTKWPPTYIRLRIRDLPLTPRATPLFRNYFEFRLWTRIPNDRNIGTMPSPP